LHSGIATQAGNNPQFNLGVICPYDLTTWCSDKTGSGCGIARNGLQGRIATGEATRPGSKLIVGRVTGIFRLEFAVGGDVNNFVLAKVIF
jgi:hypothetical protein